MNYRTKIIALSCAAAALAVLYALSLALDPARRGARADLYSWLDPRDIERIASIAIILPRIAIDASDQGLEARVLVLAREGGAWIARGEDGRSLPARADRIEAFLFELARRAPYPARARGAAVHARLSLDEESAARVIISGAFGPPILDALFGQNDLLGTGIYIRRAGSSEARLGEDRFSAYIWTEEIFWHDLALFSGETRGLADLSRITLRRAGEADTVFARAGRNWETSLEIEAINSLRVDAFAHEALLSRADGFADAQGADFGDGAVIFDFFFGESVVLGFAAPDQNGRRMVSVGGRAYWISGWLYERFFPAPESFGL